MSVVLGGSADVVVVVAGGVVGSVVVRVRGRDDPADELVGAVVVGGLVLLAGAGVPSTVALRPSGSRSAAESSGLAMTVAAPALIAPTNRAARMGRTERRLDLGMVTVGQRTTNE